MPHVTGGQETVGIRIPSHPVALELLNAFGGGLAAPSANRFGRISPTTALAVREELGDQVAYILDGGRCEVGVESTIVDVSGDAAVLLRPGVITAAQIEAVLQQKLQTKSKNAPRVSGSHLSHYAPTTPVRLLQSAELQHYLSERKKRRIAVMALSPLVEDALVVQMPADPAHYAYHLYQVLRDLDREHADEILIEALPLDACWDAVRDRVMRAAAGFSVIY